MPNNIPKLSLSQIFKRLSEIPFQYSKLDNALKPITELGKQVINSHTFALALIDPETKAVKQLVCTSNNPELEETINHKQQLWDEIASSKQGRLNPEIVDKYHLKAVYSYPLWSAESIVVGYIYHFSSISESLTKQQQGLIKSFACRAIVTIENLSNYKALEITPYQCLKTLSELSETLLTTSPKEFLKILPIKTCELFSVSTCILWEKDKEHQKFTISDYSVGIDNDYKKLELDSNFHAIQKYYDQKGIYYLPDVAQASTKFLHLEEIKKRDWVSMLSVPLRLEEEIIGILDIFTKNTRHFTEIEKEEFKCFGNYAAGLSLEKAQAIQKEADNLRDRNKLRKLTEIMLDMLNCNDADDVLKALLKGALQLVTLGNKALSSSDELIGEIGRLNHSTGDLEIVERNKCQTLNPKLKLGEGITGRALKELKPIKVDDVLNSKWRKIYVDFWEKTRSEIATPIFTDKIPVIEGKEVKKIGYKRIGVLNIESPEIQAFSKADEIYLSLLARYAAVLIDRQESDEKVSKLRQKEHQVFRYQNYNKIMEEVIQSITEILKFEVVNISLVNFETKRIKTEYIGGISEDEVEEFKKDADLALYSNDIQASIVKNRQIEVPSIEDPRFAQEVYKKYNHENLIRVFIPMIEPSRDRVIGTLEAGYKKKYRNYIYERDVQIIESFVDYVVQAIEHRRSAMMDRITHEFMAPIVGIRSNASFIQRRRKEIPQDLVDKKLGDILTDCEILLLQVSKLEYLLEGRVSKRSNIEKTYIFRDVIIKTIKQLRPIVIEHEFSIEDIDLSRIYDRFTRLRINTDKIKLNQVVYNLLINSIKYAKKDPNQFKIVIDIDDKYYNNLIVKFKDWGIGIKKEHEKEIFKEGFRCPEAKGLYVTGSGLGLTISQSIMKELGGDLILANNAEPTEFHLIIPRE